MSFTTFLGNGEVHGQKKPGVQLLSHVLLFAAPWTVAGQAPLSIEFSRQEYWSGLPFPSPKKPGDMHVSFLF